MCQAGRGSTARAFGDDAERAGIKSSNRWASTVRSMLDERDLKVDVFHSENAAGFGTWGLRVTHTPSGVAAGCNGVFLPGDDPDDGMVEMRRKLVAWIDGQLSSTAGAS